MSHRLVMVLAGCALSLAAVRPLAAQTMSPEVKATYAEIEKSFGFVPTFVKRFPEESLPGAWQELRDLDLNPSTAIPSKYKALIGAAVSAQIPCAYCEYFDTQSAKQEGTTDREIQEAIAMAALTRHWSTVLNGLRLNKAEFTADVHGIVEYAKGAAGRQTPMAEPVGSPGTELEFAL